MLWRHEARWRLALPACRSGLRGRRRRRRHDQRLERGFLTPLHGLEAAPYRICHVLTWFEAEGVLPRLHRLLPPSRAPERLTMLKEQVRPLAHQLTVLQCVGGGPAL